MRPSPLLVGGFGLCWILAFASPTAATAEDPPWLSTQVAPEESIAFTLYTLHEGTLKLTAQLYPLAPEIDRRAALEVETDAGWKEVASDRVSEEPYGWPQEDVGRWTAHFRVEGWDDTGLAYENLQARIRGCILMSLSNRFGSLVLTTGNKSETAVGYTTLYGDTAGGFGVIKDVPKTTVYELAEHINEKAGSEVIPRDVITRPPSAELRPDQRDSDSLPDYDLLDRILKGYVEGDKSVTELVRQGLPEDVVNKVIRMVDRNEYKRRLSPPGIKITPKAFGKDRRLPITNRYSNSPNGV